MNPGPDLTRYWTPVYNAFNPFEPVSIDKLKAWFVQRPDSPLQTLLSRFQPERLPQRSILVGHPSSGKSSELARLAADLSERHGYFVIQIDLSRNLDIGRVNQVEVLFLMGAAAYKVARGAKLKPDEKRFDALVKGLNTIVQTYTDNESFELDAGDLLRGLVCFGVGLLAGPVGAAAVIVSEALRNYHFISGTNIEITSKVEVEPKVNEMLGHANAILDDVAAKAGRPVALLVDGLDRVNSDVAELLFVRNRFLADPMCRVLYTAPMSVFYHPRFAPVRAVFHVTPFPNVRLRHRQDRERGDEAGYDAMRRVVNLRLTSLGYHPEPVIAPDALDTLISASGGLMRDLIRLMQDACVEAEIAGLQQIEQKIAGNVVAALRRQYEAQLTPKYRQVIEKVRQSQQRTEDEECDVLLAGNFILSYSNQDIWFDVHSILW